MTSGEHKETEQTGRDLFDPETIRRIRLTPELGSITETTREPFEGADRFDRRSPFGFLWPTISDVDSAVSAAGYGVAAALLGGVVTTILAGLAAAGVAAVRTLGVDGWAIIDAAICFAIAWGINRMSRVAAVLGLVFYILGCLVRFSQAGPRVSPVAIFIAIALINAVRGTFAYHELRSADSGRKSAMSTRHEDL
jgi:hypothetical protein